MKDVCNPYMSCPITVLNVNVVDYIFIYLKDSIYSIKKGIIIGIFMICIYSHAALS